MKFILNQRRDSMNGILSAVGFVPRTVIAAAILLTAQAINVQAQYNYTTISVPGAVDTFALGICGNNTVGYYDTGDGSSDHGFVFNGSSYTTFDVPGAVDTYAWGISGNNIVGYYDTGSGGYDQGFLYDDRSYTTLSAPSSQTTDALGISGNEIIGNYLPNEGGPVESYLYNGNYITLNVPGQVHGIDGNNIVGDYIDGSSHQGFLYNFSGSSYITLSVPGAVDTGAYGIEGNNIVGIYYNVSFAKNGEAQGFLYDGNSFTTLDVPGSIQTEAFGISGGYIVGTYEASDGIYQGFLATPVPEPSTTAFGGFAVGLLATFRLARQRQACRP